MPDKDNMPWGIAKTGWAKYATHMSMVGGLFLGPIGENSNFTKMFKLLVPEEEALLRTREYQQRICTVIAAAVANFLDCQT